MKKKRRRHSQPTLASVTNDFWNRNKINNFNNKREPIRIETESTGDRFIREEQQQVMNNNYWYFLAGIGSIILGFFLTVKSMFSGITIIIIGIGIGYVGIRDWQKAENKMRNRYERKNE